MRTNGYLISKFRTIHKRMWEIKRQHMTTRDVVYPVDFNRNIFFRDDSSRWITCINTLICEDWISVNICGWVSIWQKSLSCFHSCNLVDFLSDFLIWWSYYIYRGCYFRSPGDNICELVTFKFLGCNKIRLWVDVDGGQQKEEDNKQFIMHDWYKLGIYACCN